MENFLRVRGSKLNDPCGKSILLRGINKMFIFEQNPINRVGTKTIPEIAKTGANCIRIVWGMGRKNENGQVVASSVQELDTIITSCKNLKMIPIVGLWDFTGDAPDSGFSQLSQYVDYWTRPDVLALIKKHENALIINIANEAAPECDDSDADLEVKTPSFVAAYSNAVQRMRNAGIEVPLIIDGLDFGKSLKCFSFIRSGQNVNVATELLNADSQRNLIFSFHPYWSKRFTDGQTFVEDIFNKAVSDGFCFIIGELSKYGGWADGESICSEKGVVDYMRFAKLCITNQIGCILWEWGPGNGFADSNCIKMDMTTNGTFSGLKDWGLDLVKDPIFGFKSKTKSTKYMTNKFLKC
jgi:mannan endo-1,4-beta-mannosidase